MADNNSYKQPPRRRGPGGPGRGMMPAEKAKDFKGSIGKLIKYIGTYKIAIIFVMVMAAASTVFSVIGPKAHRCDSSSTASLSSLQIGAPDTLPLVITR